MRTSPMPPRLAIGEDERAMINAVLSFYQERNLDPGYQGHFEEQYCQAFINLMGGGFADGVATGTSAIYVAIAALNLPANSQVIVSPITDPGSLSAIILNGLVPCLTDSKPNSYNVGLEQISHRINNDTSAIMVVHAAGQAADIEAITDEAHRRGISVIEDCSQSHGATIKNKPVGTFSDIAAFSTMYRKAHITGASGGVVYSQNEDLFNQAMAHADRGKPRWLEDFDDRDPSSYLFPALNFHTDELSSAIGLASLKRLPGTIEARMKFIKGMDRLLTEARHCRPYGWSEGDSPFFYPIIVDTSELQCDKIEFSKAVQAEGIDLNPHYKYVVSEWPWIKQYLSDEFDTPNARSIRDRSFNLYLNEKYGPPEIQDTIDAIVKVENFYSTT